MYQTRCYFLFLLSIKSFVSCPWILCFSFEPPDSPSVSLVRSEASSLTTRHVLLVEGRRKRLRVPFSKRAGSLSEVKVGLQSPDLRGTFSFSWLGLLFHTLNVPQLHWAWSPKPGARFTQQYYWRWKVSLKGLKLFCYFRPTFPNSWNSTTQWAFLFFFSWISGILSGRYRQRSFTFIAVRNAFPLMSWQISAVCHSSLQSFDLLWGTRTLSSLL